MGFWDDPAVAPSSNAWMKFEAVGDEVEGTIASLSKRVFNQGTADERTAIEITFVEADVPSVTAGQVLLKNQLFELRPEPGDLLAIRLTGIERANGKTLKKFESGVKRKNGSTQLATSN